jgi:hypothetical protein
MGAIGSCFVGGWVLLDPLYPCFGCSCFLVVLCGLKRVLMVWWWWLESVEVLVVEVVVTYGGVLLLLW